MAACIARLKAVLDTDKNIAPVGERIEFKFVRDTSLRTILERDYIEIQKAFIAECWKSVVILAGGSIEAILLDRLSQDEAKARSAKCAPSDSDLSRWDLSDLIKVAIELKIVEASAGMLTDAIRQYRNLIHPGYELRNKMSIDRLEAHGGLNILNIVHRDLSR
ncbi:hypothetical protein [Candidatus Binatus sp.]|uniref:hypothetical protein n=1 Tax=Candidatus Binatus sp. TaxID=2811406 RepID=UPI00272CE6A3|nr:hypothetical protein [Candidatus Binatus sp.]